MNNNIIICNKLNTPKIVKHNFKSFYLKSNNYCCQMIIQNQIYFFSQYNAQEESNIGNSQELK